MSSRILESIMRRTFKAYVELSRRKYISSKIRFTFTRVLFQFYLLYNISVITFIYVYEESELDLMRV